MSVISSDDICMIPQRSKKVNTLSKFFLIIERKEVTGNNCFNHKIDKKSILNRMDWNTLIFLALNLRQTGRCDRLTDAAAFFIGYMQLRAGINLREVLFQHFTRLIKKERAAFA